MEIYLNCSSGCILAYDSCNSKNHNVKKMLKCRPQSVPLGARAPPLLRHWQEVLIGMESGELDLGEMLTL